MIELYTSEDVERLLAEPGMSAHARAILAALEQAYGTREDPSSSDGGRVIVVEPDDVKDGGDTLCETLGFAEAVERHEGIKPFPSFFDVCVVETNEFTTTYLIPDAVWLPTALHQFLLEQIA